MLTWMTPRLDRTRQQSLCTCADPAHRSTCSRLASPTIAQLSPARSLARSSSPPTTSQTKPPVGSFFLLALAINTRRHTSDSSLPHSTPLPLPLTRSLSPTRLEGSRCLVVLVGMAGAASASSPPPTPKSPKLQPPLLERAKGPSGLDKIVLRDPRGFTAEVHELLSPSAPPFRVDFFFPQSNRPWSIWGAFPADPLEG